VEANALLLDPPIDRVLATTNRLVLIVHDCPSSRRGIITQITSEAGNRGDDNSDAELATFFTCFLARIDNSPANRVESSTLLVANSDDYIFRDRRDEKLPENIYFQVGLIYCRGDSVVACFCPAGSGWLSRAAHAALDLSVWLGSVPFLGRY
jgi:hypothetical protein